MSTRVRLRPTRAILRVLVPVIALALAAVNYESNAAWLLACLVGALCLVSILHTRRNLTATALRVLPQAPVFAGEPITSSVEVTSAGMPAHAVQLALGRTSAEPASIPADGRRRLHVVQAGLPRGRHRLPVAELRSSFPFGIVHARLRAAEGSEILVYPQPRGRALGDAILADASTGDGHGGLDGGDFAGHRRWQPGDNQRRVDWRAVARGRPVLVKQFAGSSAECLLTWDAADGDDEARLSQLARWVLDADVLGWRYGLHLPGRTIAPGSGEPHRQACLEALALHGSAS